MGKENNHPTSETYNLNYEEELSQLEVWTKSGKAQIAQLAVTGQLEKSRFRSVIWQILLGILPHQSCLWVQALRKLRAKYRSRRDQLLVDPRQGPDDDNPLSDKSSSAWHQYFCDKELRATIWKDVVRTSPGDKFFNSESIQSTMVNILFLYAREHQSICYRQGMHEVLAPLLLVLHSDQQALLEAQKVMSVQGPILEVLDHTCLEEDAYWLLDHIMEHLACTYSIPDVTLPTGKFSSKRSKPIEIESEVCSRMRRIRDELLDKWDEELRQRLVDLDIPLYFGIRWLRVIFGQEFSMENLLIIWDAIFGADDKFGLINYIVVAMLMVIRHRLLEEDYTGCLELLVHYPADSHVHSILRLALYLLEPEVYPRPNDVFDTAKPVIQAQSPTFSGRIRRLVTRSRRQDSTLSPNSTSQRNPLFTFKGLRSDQGDAKFENYPRQLQRDSNQDPSELLMALQSKVFLTSLRLAKYQVTLEQHLATSGAPSSVLNAVEGLKEIAEMLADLGPPQIEVETAVEATPSPDVSAPNSPDPTSNSFTSTPNPSVPTKPHSPKPLASVIPIVQRTLEKEVEMKEKKGRESSKSTFVLSNPLRNMYGSEDYEPERDTSVHSNCQRLLGEGKIFARMKH